MAVTPIPGGYHAVTPYFNDGQTCAQLAPDAQGRVMVIEHTVAAAVDQDHVLDRHDGDGEMRVDADVTWLTRRCQAVQ